MPVSILDENVINDSFSGKPTPKPKVVPGKPDPVKADQNRRVLPPIPEDDDDDEKSLDMENPLEMFLDESDLTASDEDESEIRPPIQESSEPLSMKSHIEMNSENIYLDIFSEQLWEQTKKVLTLSDEGQKMLSEIQEESGVLVVPDERETRCLALIRHALSQHQDQKALEITISVTARSQYKLSL